MAHRSFDPGSNVIGKRGAVRGLKDSGLLEESLYESDDVCDSVERRLRKKALNSYKVGMKRGILMAIEAMENGTFILDRESGEVVSTADELPFPASVKRLNLSVLDGKKITVPLDAVRICITEDGIEVKGSLSS